MIKKCKWCGTEKEMNGKQVFCGNRCKQAYKYANKTGKLNKRKIDKIKPTISKNKIPNLVGQLTKVTTTMDQCLRIQIDIPVEKVGFDTIQFLNQMVVIGFVQNDEEKEYKPQRHTKERFF